MASIFIKRLVLGMIISIFLLLILGNYLIETNLLQNFQNDSREKINQISQILSKSAIEIATLKDETHESYLSKARAIAYMVEINPKVINECQELIDIAELMEIDEIYIFDEKGIIIAATIPKHLGIGIDDGEQIAYFKPILSDPSLELVQEITPNTANATLMQYSGVSRKDQKGIVQIGMQPERMLEVLSRSDVSHMLSTMITDINEVIFLVDKKTGIVTGTASNNEEHLKFSDLSFAKQITATDAVDKHVEFSDSEYFSVILETDYGIICITEKISSIMSSKLESLIFFTFSLIVIAFLMIAGIKHLLYRQVILGVEEIIAALRKITEGSLSTVVAVDNNPEFKELSLQINTMVGSLLRSTSKISRIIDALDVNIAIYEYGQDMKKVVATNRLASILGLSSLEAKTLFQDKTLFEKKIFSICQGIEDQEGDLIYRIPLSAGDRYVKIKTFNDFDTTMGIVIDATEDVLRRNIIIYERDYDILTELYNRRAFMRETDIIFSHAERLKIACVMMLDMDDLKSINDLHGHHNGDKYIKVGADVMRQSQINEKVIISRLGGDEFAILWYGYDTQEQIIANIEKLYAVMSETSIFIDETQTRPVKFSGGYAFYPEHSLEKSALLKLSDRALYCAKHNDKCKFIQYKPKKTDN